MFENTITTKKKKGTLGKEQTSLVLSNFLLKLQQPVKA